MASRSLGTLTLDLIARIGGFQQGMDRASRSVASTGASADAASARIQALQGQFLSLSSVAARVAGPLAAAFSVNSVYKATEAYSTLTNRLKLVTNNSTELAAAQKAVFDIAQSSAQPLSATAELYQRIATNQDALKLSGEGVAGIVDTISKTLAVSGASAQSANAALVQLGQAFASGVLRGEELNSVMEQAPALAQAIAAGMGKTVGELRAMGAAGELTASAVVSALQGQAGAVDELFARTATTIGNSFTKISNSMTRFIGELDQATGASSKVAAEFVGISQAIDKSLPVSLAALRNNSEVLSQALTAGLFVALGRIAGGFAQQGAAALYAAASNQALLTSAAATARGDLYAAQAKQIDAKALLQRAGLEIKAAEGKVASDRVRQASELANIKSVQASLAAERLLEQQRLAAQITDIGRTASISRIAELRLAEVAVTKKVEQAERSLAATTVATSAQIERAYAMRTAAAAAYAETTVAVNALTIASNNAAAAASITSRAFGALAAAGRGLLALLGGPVGLLFIAGAVALSFVDFRTSSDKAKEGLEQLKGPLDEVIARFRRLTQEQKAGALVRWGEAQAEAVKAANAELGTLQQTLKKGILGSDSLSMSSRIAGSSNKEIIDKGKAYVDLSRRLEDAAKKGQSILPILEEASRVPGVPAKFLDTLKKEAEAWSNQDEARKEAAKNLAALHGEMNKGGASAAGSAKATTGLTTAGEKYLKTLQDQLGKLQDNNDAVKEASRYIAEHKELTEADRTAIMSAAHAKKAQAEANKHATAQTKSNTSAIKENNKTFENAEENYKRQIELINTTTDKQKNATEVEKLAFEVASGKYAALSEQRKQVLAGYATELDAKKALLKADEDAKKIAAFSTNVKENNQSVKDGFNQELAGAGAGDKRKAQLQEMLAIEQDFNRQQRELLLQRNSGDISQELYEAETDLLSEALAERLVLQQDYYNQLDDAQNNWLDGVSSAWENYRDIALDYQQQAADFTSSMLQDVTTNFGDNIAAMALEGQTLGETLENVAVGFGKSMVNALAQVAAQWLITQAIQLVTGKATQASAATAMAANAQATSLQAGLAAFASTAAIPIVGPLAAPGAMAAALAVTSPMAAAVGITAMAGMAHDGIDSIPQTGTWLLEKGERVTTASTSAKLDRTLESIGTGQRSGRNAGRNAAPITQNNYYPTQPDNRTANQSAAAMARKQRQASRHQ